MVGCTAPNCTGNTRKGDKLFVFPRFGSRRKKWIENCGKLNWTPTPCTKLCWLHFECNQFNKKGKLSKDAVPTIFFTERAKYEMDERRKVLQRAVGKELRELPEIQQNFTTKQSLKIMKYDNAGEGYVYDKMEEKCDNFEDNDVENNGIISCHNSEDTVVQKNGEFCSCCMKTRNKNCQLQLEINQLREEMKNIEKNLQKYFQKDQIELMKKTFPRKRKRQTTQIIINVEDLDGWQ